MATVELTRHLYTFFPALAGKPLEIANVTTVAEVVRALEELAPGIGFYVCDERGRLRRHVNIFVDEQMIADRGQLSDRVEANSRIMIMQALSGG
jgi:molybdopterin synthase sulfur carrier subunit